jgi:bacterioferritin-associated ferredoxin
MYICLCNPFSDKDVRDFLAKQDGAASVSEVYRCCSGGEAPCCGTCVPTLKDMVREHNGRKAVRDLGRKLKKQAA